jgi:hypothetical protein
MSVRTRVKCALGAAVVMVGAAVPAAAFASSSSPTTPVKSGAGSISGIHVPRKVPAPGTSKASGPQCTTSNLPAAKAYVQKDLQRRVTELGVLQARVTASTKLTRSDRSELQSDLAGDLSAMHGLETEVSGDTTCAALVSVAHTMVFSYRVFLVMAPKTDLVIVADTESAVATQIQAAESRIESAINASGKTGKKAAADEHAFGALETATTGALKALDGVSATVMAQTPAGSPGNRPVLVNARKSCQTAYVDLRQAREDLAKIGAL